MTDEETGVAICEGWRVVDGLGSVAEVAARVWQAVGT